MKPLRQVFALLAVCCVFGTAAWADAVEDCDRLAGDPAVAMAAIAPEAEAACAAAVDQDDQTPRLMHEYARTLEHAGEMAAALRYYGWAAEDGYPPAALALARLGQTAAGSDAGQPGGGGAEADDPVAAYAAAAGQDPAGLAQAVSRDITILPTAAALRSPQDVLALRRASLADAARLLQALIMARDPAAETRFGICRMSTAQATELAQLLAGKTASAVPSLRTALDQAAATPGLDPAVLATLGDLSRQWGAAIDAGKAEAAALTADMRQAGLETAPEPLDRRAAVLAGQDRYLVEVHEAGQWRTYDPASGGSFDGTACARYATAHALPQDLAPLVHITLTATEGTAGDAPADRVVLDQTLPFTQSLVLAFAEAWSITPPDASRQPGAQVYTPVLLAADQQLFGQPIVLPVAPSMPADLGTAIGGKLGGVLDQTSSDGTQTGAGTDGGAALPKAPDRLWRLALTVSLSGPGAPTEVQHILLLDRKDLTQPLPDFGANYLDFLGLVTLLPLDGGARADAVIPAGTGGDFAAGALAQQLRSTGLAMNGFEPLRQAIFADLSPDTPAPLPEGVGLLMTLWHALPPAAAGEAPGLSIRQQMLRPVEPVAQGVADPAFAGAAWGVASVLAERISLQIAAPLAGATRAGDDAVAVWTKARQTGSARPVTAMADLAGLSDGARVRAAAALTSGHVLFSPVPDLVPAAEPGLAWWVVAPAGAVVEDQFADGGREALVDDGATLRQVACRSAASYFRFGSTVARVASVVAIVFTLTGGGGELGGALVKYATAIVKAQEESDKTRRALDVAAKACTGGQGGAP